VSQCFAGDCREILPTLGDGSVQCCVTSPPYWGLRDYGTAGQLGLERTPEQYVENMVAVFREVRRVLRNDGTLWLNLGDSYANDGKWGGSSGGKHVSALHGESGIGRGRRQTGLKPKDLVGIPWRVAFALQADGWWLRQDIIWHKPNPMPESVTDRCTKSHEYLFLLSKSARYYFDAKAIAEPASYTEGSGNMNKSAYVVAAQTDPKMRTKAGLADIGPREFRNLRSVWTIPTEPTKEAHFATFPQALVSPCVLVGSRVGDTVLDPFFGSGTVGEVCERLGRQWIGCELNPQYIAISSRRTEQRGVFG
jgi:DNA modification methylase